MKKIDTTAGRIGVRNVVVAFLTKDDSTGVAYEPPILIAGTMQMTLTPRIADDKIYGDGKVREHAVEMDGYDATLEHNRIPAEILARMLGKRINKATGIRRGNVRDRIAKFAIGYIIDLAGGFVECVWLTKCTVVPPEKNTTQKTDSLTHSPDSLPITSIPLAYNDDYDYIGDTSDKDSGFTDATAATFFDTVPVLPPLSPVEPAGASAEVAATKAGK